MPKPSTVKTLHSHKSGKPPAAGNQACRETGTAICPAGRHELCNAWGRIPKSVPHMIVRREHETVWSTECRSGSCAHDRRFRQFQKRMANNIQKCVQLITSGRNVVTVLSATTACFAGLQSRSDTQVREDATLLIQSCLNSSDKVVLVVASHTLCYHLRAFDVLDVAGLVVFSILRQISTMSHAATLFSYVLHNCCDCLILVCGNQDVVLEGVRQLFIVGSRIGNSAQ